MSVFKMLALVAYGSSDESEDESEVEAETSLPNKDSSATVSVLPSKVEAYPKHDVVSHADEKQSSIQKSEDGDKELNSSGLGLLSKLPVPKTQNSSILHDSLLHPLKDSIRANKRGPVKISIPSMSEFADDDDDEPRPKKKIQPSAKGSGLFSLLPPPKHTFTKEANRSLLPNALTRKPIVPTPAKKQLKKITAKTLPKPSPSKQHVDSDPESDGDGDFFSLNKEDTLPDIPAFTVPVSVDGASAELLNAHSEPQGEAYYQNNYEGASTADDYQNQEVTGVPETQANSGQDYIPFEGGDLQLDDEALQRLCGRGGRRRREEVQLLDVSGKDIMPDSREWLTKQLTEEQPRHSSSKNKFGGPSQQERRKHQITYLAHVAKENELELKNSWANNRQTRKQTQSKYGF